MSEVNAKDGTQEETSTRVLYEQLQNEYNKLLKQYAAAENTIDELRTGATVHLYTEPIESRLNSRLSYDEVRFSKSINLPRPLNATTSEYSTMNGICSTNTSGSRLENIRTPSPERNNGQYLSLEARIHALKQNVATVECILSESALNNEDNLNELLGICTQLYKEHGILTRELKLQSRNTIHRSGQSDENGFTKTELEKELYRIGLRIEEIQGDIMARLKTKKHAVKKFETPPNHAKSTLGTHLEGLVREMKDLKDASIRSSDEVLNSSRKENSLRKSVSPNGKNSEHTQDFAQDLAQDMLDARYLAASPVNLEYPPVDDLSGSERGSDNSSEQAFGMTWPPTRNVPDSDIGVLRHSFSDALQDYHRNDFDHSKQSPRNSDQAKADHFNSGNSLKEQHSGQLRQHRPDLNTSMDHFNSTRQHSPSWNEDVLRHSSEPDRSADYSNLGHDSKVCENLGPTNENSPFSSQETVRCRSDSKIPVGEKNEHLHSGEHCDQKSVRQKKRHEQSARELQEYEAARNKTPDLQRFSSPDVKPRKCNSMSSFGDSSRMSTPLFRPSRGSTQVPKYKRRNTNDDVDSGFVGSEASRSSRLTTDHSDGVQKLGISNQWDSSLQLDLVSEIDENEVSSSPEQMSTTCEDGRRSPIKALTRRQLDEHSKFINSSPSPLSSPENSFRTPEGRFGYKTSHTRLPSNGNLLPVHDTHDPEISNGRTRGSERAPVEHRPHSRRGSSIDGTSALIETSVDRQNISRKYSGPSDVPPEATADISNSGFGNVGSRDKTNEHKNERKLQSLRSELDSLHDHVSKLQHPRVTMDTYDELRDHDEQLRRAYERRHDRKLDALRHEIEQLKNNINRSRQPSVNRRLPDQDSEFYDDFRNELRKITEKLNELTVIQGSEAEQLESRSDRDSPHDEAMAKRFSNLVRKVDELRRRIENDARDNSEASHKNSRHFCHLCDDADEHRHRHRTVSTSYHQPRTSTPFVSDLHRPYEQFPRAKVQHRHYLSSTYPGTTPQQSPLVHHIHTYHQGPELKQDYETDSDDDNYVKRTSHRKRRLHRTRYQSRLDASYGGRVSLDEARRAARDVQRLSKNILNTISLDLTSLRS
ncbi:uncharacterized protein LOC114530931 [Dendronephthya gigantea]|uniref:uncharacterized protein LOC114530931 n=1 Tax=Dendronephthya gigantea TaxID=151771 RepID=UPI00106A5E68|nr:uncharacterized protein LOC114530931 [Dendronephthya gigantea]